MLPDHFSKIQQDLWLPTRSGDNHDPRGELSPARLVVHLRRE